jgi:hypothetical protein
MNKTGATSLHPGPGVRGPVLRGYIPKPQATGTKAAYPGTPPKRVRVCGFLCIGLARVEPFPDASPGASDPFVAATPSFGFAAL